MFKSFYTLTRFQPHASLFVRWTSGIAVAAFEFQEILTMLAWAE
jgi:hypothetical protein